MTDDTAGEKPDYMAEIETLSALVDKGRGLVDANHSVDLSSLETAIGDLCKRMAENPPDDANAVTTAIHELVERLGELGSALQKQQDRRGK